MKCGVCRYNDMKNVCLNVNSKFFMCKTDTEKTKEGCEYFVEAKNIKCENCEYLQNGICNNVDSAFYMHREYEVIIRKGCENGKEKDK